MATRYNPREIGGETLDDLDFHDAQRIIWWAEHLAQPCRPNREHFAQARAEHDAGRSAPWEHGLMLRNPTITIEADSRPVAVDPNNPPWAVPEPREPGLDHWFRPRRPSATPWG